MRTLLLIHGMSKCSSAFLFVQLVENYLHRVVNSGSTPRLSLFPGLVHHYCSQRLTNVSLCYGMSTQPLHTVLLHCVSCIWSWMVCRVMWCTVGTLNEQTLWVCVDCLELRSWNGEMPRKEFQVALSLWRRRSDGKWAWIATVVCEHAEITPDRLRQKKKRWETETCISVVEKAR